MFSHYDRPRIANLAEKAGLLQRVRSVWRLRNFGAYAYLGFRVSRPSSTMKTSTTSNASWSITRTRSTRMYAVCSSRSDWPLEADFLGSGSSTTLAVSQSTRLMRF
jgi:hypothetical protein